MIEKRIQLEPPYCPLHDQCAPCMACLGPVVAQMVRYENAINGVVFLFCPNMDEN